MKRFKNSLLLSYLTTNRWRIYGIMVIGILYSLSSFMITVLIGAFFELQYGSTTNRTILLQMLGFSIKSIPMFFTLISGLLISKGLLSLFERQQVFNVTENFISNLTETLFKKQMFWPHEYFAQKSYGKYLLRYSGDLGSVRKLFTLGVHRTLRDLIFILTGFGLLVVLDWRLFGIITLALIVISPVNLWINSLQKPLITSLGNKKSQVLDFVMNAFSMHKSIGENNRRNSFVRKFKDKLSKQKSVEKHYQFVENLRLTFLPLVNNYLMIILFGAIVYQMDSQLGPGGLLIFLLVLSTLASPIRSVLKSSSIIQKGMISLNKIAGMLQQKTLANDFRKDCVSEKNPVDIEQVKKIITLSKSI